MKKSLLIVALVLALIYSAGGIYFYVFDEKEINTVNNIAVIKGYNYSLKDVATPLMKEEFNILKKNLESNNIEEESFANSIAKLFIIDIYTLNNKLNKYDIGGIEYLLTDYIDNFKLNITNTLYKYLEDNSDKKRAQNLPTVKSISTTNTEEFTYELNDKSYEGYKIQLSWDYITDLEYDTSAEVTVIKLDNKYYIAEKNNIE